MLTSVEFLTVYYTLTDDVIQFKVCFKHIVQKGSFSSFPACLVVQVCYIPDHNQHMAGLQNNKFYIRSLK